MSSLSRREFLGAVACAFAVAGITHTIPAAAIAPESGGRVRIVVGYRPHWVILRRIFRADCLVVFEHINHQAFTVDGFYAPAPREGEIVGFEAYEPPMEGVGKLFGRLTFGEVRA